MAVACKQPEFMNRETHPLTVGSADVPFVVRFFGRFRNVACHTKIALNTVWRWYYGYTQHETHGAPLIRQR